MGIDATAWIETRTLLADGKFSQWQVEEYFECVLERDYTLHEYVFGYCFPKSGVFPLSRKSGKPEGLSKTIIDYFEEDYEYTEFYWVEKKDLKKLEIQRSLNLPFFYTDIYLKKNMKYIGKKEIPGQITMDEIELFLNRGEYTKGKYLYKLIKYSSQIELQDGWFSLFMKVKTILDRNDTDIRLIGEFS